MSSAYYEIDSDDALSWPDNAPSVSVDVRLGKLGRKIDFDMQTVVRLLECEGIKTDSPRLHYEIDSEHNPRHRYDYGSYAVSEESTKEDFLSKIPQKYRHLYTTPDRLTRVELSDNLNKANRVLLHQTKHYVQDMGGNLSSPEIRTRKSRMYSLSIFAGSIGMIAAEFGGLVPRIGGEYYAPFFVINAFMAPLFTGPLLEQITNANEREARRFAKKPPFRAAKNILSLV